jgi:hypothetical protein
MSGICTVLSVTTVTADQQILFNCAQSFFHLVLLLALLSHIESLNQRPKTVLFSSSLIADLL